MADQPQPTPPAGQTSPTNNSRITAMLQDLAAQRASGTDTPRPPTTTPTPPPNLPVTPAPRPSVAPMPAPRPITPPPAPVQSPPPAPKEPPVAPMPAVPRPPAPVPPPTPPRPVITVPPAIRPPAPAVLPPKAPAPSGSGESYSAELRTMSADIGNIKTGQAPAGIRQSTPSAPVPAAPAPVAPPAKPVMPIVPPRAPTVPVIPTLPVVLKAPVVPRAPVIPSAPTVIVVPASSSGGMFRKLLYGVMVLVILGGIAYAVVAFINRDSSPDVTASPTPTVSASNSPTPISGAKNLRSYFGDPSKSVNLQSTSTGKDDLLNALVGVQPASRTATAIAVQHRGIDATASLFFNDTIGSIPADVSASLGNEWSLLVYGQSEGFDQNGIRTNATSNGIRLIVLLELTDVTKANQAMTAWETSGLATVSAGLFQYNMAQEIVTSFNSGTYRQFVLRYWNFPYADRSIDYAIVTASNGKNYLLLSGSREAAFFAIDQLMQ